MLVFTINVRVTRCKSSVAEEPVIIEYSRERGTAVAKRREVALYVDTAVIERVKYELITERGAWIDGENGTVRAGTANTINLFYIISFV